MNMLKKLRISSSTELNIGTFTILGLLTFVPNIIYLPHSVTLGIALFACMLSTHGFIRSGREIKKIRTDMAIQKEQNSEAIEHIKPIKPIAPKLVFSSEDDVLKLLDFEKEINS